MAVLFCLLLPYFLKLKKILELMVIPAIQQNTRPDSMTTICQTPPSTVCQLLSPPDEGGAGWDYPLIDVDGVVTLFSGFFIYCRSWSAHFPRKMGTAQMKANSWWQLRWKLTAGDNWVDSWQLMTAEMPAESWWPLIWQLAAGYK